MCQGKVYKMCVNSFSAIFVSDGSLWMIPLRVRIHVFTAPLVSKAFITHRMGRNSVISKLIPSWGTLIGKFGRSSCLEFAGCCVIRSFASCGQEECRGSSFQVRVILSLMKYCVAKFRERSTSDGGTNWTARISLQTEVRTDPFSLYVCFLTLDHVMLRNSFFQMSSCAHANVRITYHEKHKRKLPMRTYVVWNRKQNVQAEKVFSHQFNTNLHSSSFSRDSSVLSFLYHVLATINNRSYPGTCENATCHPSSTGT